MLKKLDLVAATNMIANAWRETPHSVIQNCFRKAGFTHAEVDPQPVPEEPEPVPAPEVWNRVQQWIGDIPFEEFAASEPDYTTTPEMSDDDIVRAVQGGDKAPEEESDDEADETEAEAQPAVKNVTQFLNMIDQQIAYLSHHNQPLEHIQRLQAQVIGSQYTLCTKQKPASDFFRRKAPAARRSLTYDDDDDDAEVSSTPTSSQNSVSTGSTVSTPTQSQGRAHREYDELSTISGSQYSLVDSLDIMDDEDCELALINTTIASSAVNALLNGSDAVVTPPRASTPTTTPTATPKALTSATPKSTPQAKMTRPISILHPPHTPSWI